MSVETELDTIRKKLHDSAAIWGAAELLRWWNDAYREFLARAKCVSRPWNIDVPGGFTYAYTHEWESAYLTGTHNKFTVAIQSGNLAGTFFWEAEFIEGITPTNSKDACSQPWERTLLSDWDGQFRFALPRNHEQIKRVSWNERRLSPVTTKELDESERGWNRESGSPIVFTAGLGRVKTFEVYAIRTTSTQGYALEEYEHGVPRKYSGSRTYTATTTQENIYAYMSPGESALGFLRVGWRFTKASADGQYFAAHTWEKELIDGETDLTDSPAIIGTYSWESVLGAENVQSFSLGGVRGASSPDRQYLPIYHDPTSERFAGTVRDWKSSTQAVQVWQTILPDRALVTTESPVLLPAQMLKYLRYYVLSRAFGRQGEGYNAVLAGHYERRFRQGVDKFNHLSALTNRDVVYAREPAHERRGRPPRPKLPSNFPRITV